MKVALIGYGKMGKEIESILIDRGHTVSLIIDIDNASDLDAVHLAGVDVAIEFTTPQTAFGNIRPVSRRVFRWVCGTTGWLDRFEEVKETCRSRNGAFFYASNYSVGSQCLL